MWLGWSLSTWETIFFWLTAAAAVLGGLSVSAAFFSAIIGYRISDAVQREANERISANETETARAQNDASKANLRAAELANETEALKGANLKLEAQLAPRRLKPEQQQAIASALTKFAGRKVRVKSYALDFEAAVLGQQIIDCLRAARIVVDDNRMSQGALGSIATGIRVTGDDKELARVWTHSLIQ